MVNENSTRELRQKIDHLKSELKEKHEERNDLERQLEMVQRDLDAQRESAQLAAAKSDDDTDADNEEELWLPRDTDASHPLRLIEFPRNFNQRLNEFPRHVARGALVMLGRLAAGEAAAFAGCRRLKSRPNVVRQRIGIDFRLLFRLQPDAIQVIDLIPRQDFERRIKSL